jgi:ribosomal protein L11 methyltransferase
MYFLQLTCSTEEVDFISAELWEAGTIGIREEPASDQVLVSAAFESNTLREKLLLTYARCGAKWQHMADTDWVQQTEAAWPVRNIGQRLQLVTPWNQDSAHEGRIRLIHNPGMACGTGDHPCTQLALKALEETLELGDRVADIGTGSGILAIAARLLGAASAAGFDSDCEVLAAANANFDLNALPATLVCGSADCVGSGSVGLVVANINATVLLSLADDLLRLQLGGAGLILTGFLVTEAQPLRQTFAVSREEQQDGWSCLICASV